MSLADDVQRLKERVEQVEGQTSPSSEHGNASHSPDFLKESGYTKGDIVAANGSGLLSLLGIGANGAGLVADSAQTLGIKYVAFKIEVACVIANAGTVSTTKPRVTIPLPFGFTVTRVEVKTGKDEVCGATSLIVDIHKITAPSTDGTGTTLYTTQGNRPTITNTNRFVNATLPDVTAVAENDYLAFFIDQAGTNVTTITITVYGTRDA